MPNFNTPIQILQNKIVIETIILFSNYSHLTCVHKFDAQNDIFELRSQEPGEVSEFCFFFIFIYYLNFKFLFKGNNISENHR